MSPLRVLLVDDSVSVRAVVRRFLTQDPGLELVGEAPDGEAAVEAAARLRPDVIVMDLQMPVLDGLVAIERIMAARPVPIIVLSSRANRNLAETAFEAMRRGALEVLPKPEDTESWHELSRSLPRVVHAVARGAEPRQRAGPRGTTTFAPAVGRLRWVVVGASTGGPVALRDLLAELPRSAPVSVLIVQHIAPGFEPGLADWLARSTELNVGLALDGERPTAGTARICPPNVHLHLLAGGVLHLDAITPPRRSHRPSADELFQSASTASPRETAGILLTGMGVDGAEGLLALRQAGAMTLVQDEASCAVFGMPRAALERAAAELAMAPADLGRTLRQTWERGG
ncbi:MAG: chemotaxis-specific protein-glutamate methyltransferase CheB [Acidobacteriota bacterium]